MLRHATELQVDKGRREFAAAERRPVLSPRRKPSLFYTSAQFRSGPAGLSITPFLQAQRLLASSRWQVPRYVGGRRHRIRLTPKTSSTLKGSQTIPRRLFDPYRVGWSVARTVPWAAFACGELARGYYRSAFQAGNKRRWE